jgi:CheY-like chemotaxis protein
MIAFSKTPGQNRGRPKVLVVDDERVIADTLAVILRQSGFETATAYDGMEAVQTATAWHPDLLISDVVMPRMNGIEAALLIRASIPDCKVLLFSGQASTAEMLAEARSSGCDFELISKPIHPDDLIEKLRSL